MTEVVEFRAGARLETDVPGIDSAIWTDVSDIGTVLEFEVTGFAHVVAEHSWPCHPVDC